MTGTPLDLTPFGAVLSAIGWLYWLIAVAVIVLALCLPKRPWQKLIASGIALLALYLVLVRPVQVRVHEQRQQRQEASAKLQESIALFKKRCATAGEKVNRTAENVDGVVWMKWRETSVNYGDQFKLDDPYGRDCGGEACIADLLRVTRGAQLNPEEAKQYKGYRYVESTDPFSSSQYRYHGVLRPGAGWSQAAIEQYRKDKGRDVDAAIYRFSLEREPIQRLTARYGITWDDISTREDREHWIAGGTLRVIDLQTNEVIAERVGYMMDPGQGSTAGFRSPWGDAPRSACPTFKKAPGGGPFMSFRTRDFVTQILKPVQGD